MKKSSHIVGIFFCMDAITLYDLFGDSLGKIVTDTRTLQQDDIYFALKGANFNGNAFAIQALEMGARFVVVDENIKEDKRVIQVDNVLMCMQDLAKIHRKKMNANVIGITGSNGKTTTKELLFSILKEKFQTLATQGNLNNHIGVPLTIFKLEPRHEILILEMGANKPGDISELAEIGIPDLALITSLGKAHLEGFGSFEGVIRTKRELFDNVASRGGTLFFNFNDPMIKTLYGEFKNGLSFGNTDTNADYTYDLLQQIPEIKLQAVYNQEKIEYSSHLFGVHNYQNVISSITIARYLGLNIDQINRGLNEYHPNNMRSQITNWQQNKVILDAYNANPSSMSAAIGSLLQFDHNAKWVILGKMAELGDSSEAEHQNIIKLLATCDFEKVLLIGKEYKKEIIQPGMLAFENVDQAKEWINQYRPIDKLILIKGSRSSQLEKLLLE